MRRPRRPDLAGAASALLAAAGVAALAAVVAPVAHARADEGIAPAAGGTLALAADPPRLVLGRDAAAELRLAAPPEVEEVTFTASVGRVEAVRRLPGGGFAARYRPPPERFPQVAIIAAMGFGRGRASQDGWLALPLAGSGDARVKTRPGAEIALQIAGEVFGPRRADEAGRVVIPVVVPPGVREAHHGFTPVALHVPETSLLHAAADRGQVRADRAERVRVLALVVAPHGAARRGDVPIFEPTRGTVTVAPREPGAFDATWTLPPGPAGDARLAVRIPGAPASRAVVDVKAVAGPPAQVAVAFDREVLAAGEADHVTVTARALDSAGNPAAAQVSLEADGVPLEAPAAGGPGAPGSPGPAGPPGPPGWAEARLAVSPVLGPRRAIVVTARTAEGVTGGKVLRLEPGPAAEIRFEPPDPVQRAGRPEPSLRVISLDRFGNPIAVAPGVVAAAQGRLALAPAAPESGFQLSWFAPPVARPAVVALEARAGEARGRAGLLLLPPRPALALAVSGGAAADARGRFAAGLLHVAVDRPLAGFDGLGAAATFAWRLEAVGLAGGGARTGLGLFGGASLRRVLHAGPEWFASAAAGGLGLRAGGAGGLSPGARLGAGLALPRLAGAPYLEVSALAAARGPGGGFLAAGLALGFRFERG